MRNQLLFLILFTAFFSSANEGTGSIYVNVQKLHSLKRVLYVAAHPDDENTRALAWFSLGEKAETAYFSLTRGDGGQNLIGNELGENLGVLRTQELLAARSYDGAKQYFSRAVDFGYSKSAEESLEKWGKDALLEDLVLMIRKFRPDVLVTRFPPDERAGHGHHTASALLAIEAFHKAADANFLPEQVKQLGTWQATSIYWNTSYWWDENIKDLSPDDPDYLITDIGEYNPLLGASYNEIGTLARSQHKCQGFGAVVEQGSRIEYFKHLDGQKLENSFFEGKTETWTSLLNAKLEQKFTKLLADFDFVNPENNVPQLLEILGDLNQLEDGFFKEEKLKRCKQIVMDCLGLTAELQAENYSFVSGESVSLKLALLNRSPVQVKLTGARLNTGETLDGEFVLPSNEWLSEELTSNGRVPISSPYWLDAPFDDLFRVSDRHLLGLAENPPSIFVVLELLIDGKSFAIEVPAMYKWGDPSYGERRRSLIATPKLTATLDQDFCLIKPGASKKIRVKIHGFQDSINETINIQVSEKWSVSPKNFAFQSSRMDEEQWFEFELKNEGSTSDGTLRLTNNNGELLDQIREITYDHIPTQTIFKSAEMGCKSLDVKIRPNKVAYITGVDDEVSQAIENLGFEVSVLNVSDLSTTDLSQFGTVVLGIRVYNVFPELANYQGKLEAFVSNGGNVIMQYNTATKSLSDITLGPKPFSLSRNRVTEEDAAVEILVPKHPIFNEPNTITMKDFDGWVQERGLYFAENWDPSFVPLIAWHDQDETAQEGGLIVLKYGKGQFVYTGISFFRELPNGVTGAYRLFANLLSYQP